MKSMAESQGEFKHKWNHRLHYTMLKMEQQLDRAQALYKENFNKRLRKQPECITDGNDLFFQLIEEQSKGHRNILPPVTKVSFKVIKANKKLSSLNISIDQ